MVAQSKRKDTSQNDMQKGLLREIEALSDILKGDTIEVSRIAEYSAMIFSAKEKFVSQRCR
ncbi:MAG: hypothetical protein IKF90_21810 [Parasporobacterium sp.]|nr:hypothetical protein [Parasporobacterium sp.]